MSNRFKVSKYLFHQQDKIRRLKKIQKTRFIIRAIDVLHRRIIIQDVSQIYLVSEQGCDCEQEEQQCIHLLWYKKRNIWQNLRTPCLACHQYIENDQYKDCQQCSKLFHDECLKEQWRDVCMHCKTGKISKLDKILLLQTLPEKIQEVAVPQLPERINQPYCWGYGKPNSIKTTCGYCNAKRQV